MSETPNGTLRGTTAKHDQDLERATGPEGVSSETAVGSDRKREPDIGAGRLDRGTEAGRQDSGGTDDRSWPGCWTESSLLEFISPALKSAPEFVRDRIGELIQRKRLKVPADIFTLAKDPTILESELGISKIAALEITTAIDDSRKVPLSTLVRCLLGDKGTDALVSGIVSRYKTYQAFWHGLHDAINPENPEHGPFMALPGMTPQIATRLWTFDTTLSGDIHDFVCRFEIV